MTETLSPTSPETLDSTSPEMFTRSSPKTGTVFATGRPFWIVDGKAYDFTEWIGRHPGGATWFTQTQGRDISALLHTYHPEPAGLQKMLARFEIKEPVELDGSPEVSDRPPVPTAQDIMPKLGVPPFLLAPDFDARTDLPHLDYSSQNSLLAKIRSSLNDSISRKQLKRYDRLFDGVTWAIGILHVATLVLLLTNVIAPWAFVLITVLTRTALAGAGHYHVHRKWKRRSKGRRLQLPIAKALFDINYVGTSLIGTDGHVLLHHPYLSSGADVKKTFFDAMLKLHPLLRVPGHTLHKLGIALTGLSMRGREIAKFEQPRMDGKKADDRKADDRRADDTAEDKADKQPPPPDAARVDFWLVRAMILVELGLCLATGHVLAWFVQFFITLWLNTFLVVASHDFEDSKSEDEELAAIPEHLRNDWAAQQICLSYDLTVVGNRWIDIFLSAGLSPHRVHHVLPWQGSGFANLASEAAVRKACEEAGITWQRPRSLIFDRFPKVIKHYMFCPAKAGAPVPEGPPPGQPMGAMPPAGPPKGEMPPAGPPMGDGPRPPMGAMPPAGPPKGEMPPAGPPMGDGPRPPMGDGPRPQMGEQPPAGPPMGETPAASLVSSPTPPRLTVRGQIGEFLSYTAGGFRGVGV